MDLDEELALLVRALDDAEAPYALCGALALAVYGVPRATKDIDILARRQDVDAVRGAVRGIGYLIEALPMTFTSGVEVQRFSKLVDGTALMLDVLWASGPLAAMWDRRTRVPWRTTELCVVSRGDLITLKLTAGRPQDLADIAALARLEGRDDSS